MDISQKLIGDEMSCTTMSMYLSFDEDNTIYTEAYKTLDVMKAEAKETNLYIIDEKTQSEVKLSNSTLKDSNLTLSEISPVKTDKNYQVEVFSPKLVASLPKNILQQFKAASSTPAKEDLLEDNKVKQGMIKNNKNSMGKNENEQKDTVIASFSTSPCYKIGENKENISPTDVDVKISKLSPSIMGKKILNNSNEENRSQTKNGQNSNNVLREILTDDGQEDHEKLTKLKQNSTAEIVKTANDELIMAPDLTKTITTTELEKQILTDSDKINIMNKENLIKSKPDYPARVERKRQSMLPTLKIGKTLGSNSFPSKNESDIPLLMNKILKISNTTTEFNRRQSKHDSGLIKTCRIDKQNSNSVVTIKGRQSLLPIAGDKRRFNFSNRLSVVVKTTLNSPCKMPRKSVIGSNMIPSIGMDKNTYDGSTVSENNINSKLPTPRIILSDGIGMNIKDTRTMETKISKNIKETNSHTGIPTHTKPDLNYTCPVCKEKFRIKSIMDAHKRSHKIDLPTISIKKSNENILITPNTPNVNNISPLSVTSQCKYCDKKFALRRTLHVHLLQNCSKIPPKEKRKLQYTEMDHVEKAQLPNVFNNNNHNNQTKSTQSLNKIMPKQKNNKMDNISYNSIESLIENKEMKEISSINGEMLNGNIALVQTTRKKTAYAGIFRTPSKSVPCHLCKITFKSILEYTNHILTIHSKDNSQINN